MKSKSLFKVLRVIITVLLLAYVFWKSGLFSTDGRAEFIGTVGSASLFYVLLSIMFPSFLDFISSIKWHYLSRTIGIPSRPLQLWAYYIMGRFFNLVLPSNIGGDIIRVHLHGKASGMKAQCAAAVFMERFTGLIALILIALVIGWLQSKVLNIPFMDVAMLVTMGATLFGGWAIIDDRLFNWLRMLSGKITSKLDPVFIKINKFRSSVLLYRKSPRGLLWSMINSFVFYAVAIVYAWVAVLAFDQEASLQAMAIAVPLIMVMMNLPISIGSIGLMEFAYTVTLGAVGISPETALATALLMRSHTLISAALGGTLYSFRHDKGAEELMHTTQSDSTK